jgi:hypothetical protein
MQVVKKADWESHKLQENDRVELLHFVGGGWFILWNIRHFTLFFSQKMLFSSSQNSIIIPVPILMLTFWAVRNITLTGVCHRSFTVYSYIYFCCNFSTWPFSYSLRIQIQISFT